jgi:N-acylneuraminate cytidylyltransferase
VNVAILPARGGSKRIPRKNIREFCGKPMIAWPIEAAKATGLFERIVVSTDDSEVAALVREWGAEVPFVRPAELADDFATTDAVLLHAIAECRRLLGDFPLGCCIYPTNPLISPQDLLLGRELLLEHGATSCFPLVRYDFPVEQAFLLDGARPRARWPEKLEARSQDLPDSFHDAGSFYWFDTAKLVAAGRLFGEDIVGFEIPSARCQDVNLPDDWAAAEIKVRLLRERVER